MNPRYLGLFAGLAIGLCGSSANAEDNFDPGGPMRTFVKALEKNHFRQLKVDDELSSAAFDLFIGKLDPKRMYFLRSDLEEFEKYRSQFDDLARAGDLSFAVLARQRLRQRLARAADYAAEFAVADHDYTIDESYPKNFETFAPNRAALKERWRLRIKAERMLERLHGRSRAEIEVQLTDRYQRILDQALNMNDERLCTLFLNSIGRAIGPNTTYLSESMLSSFRGGLLREFTFGLGVIDEHGVPTIRYIAPGLRRKADPKRLIGWQLVAFQTERGEWIDLVEMPIDEVQELFRRDWGEVSLELFDPVTCERASIAWRSYLS